MTSPWSSTAVMQEVRAQHDVEFAFKAAAELDRLKADIESYVSAAADLATENERQREALERIAENDSSDPPGEWGLNGRIALRALGTKPTS